MSDQRDVRTEATTLGSNRSNVAALIVEGKVLAVTIQDNQHRSAFLYPSELRDLVDFLARHGLIASPSHA